MPFPHEMSVWQYLAFMGFLLFLILTLPPITIWARNAWRRHQIRRWQRRRG